MSAPVLANVVSVSVKYETHTHTHTHTLARARTLHLQWDQYGAGVVDVFAIAARAHAKKIWTALLGISRSSAGFGVVTALLASNQVDRKCDVSHASVAELGSRAL